MFLGDSVLQLELLGLAHELQGHAGAQRITIIPSHIPVPEVSWQDVVKYDTH